MEPWLGGSAAELGLPLPRLIAVTLAPDADLETAGRVSERVHLLIRRLGLEGISLSIGLAQLSGKQGVKEFIRQADEAMYLAKQMGGDRSVVFSV